MIYTSERVLPYVYMCTHKVTGEFYIGSRYSKNLKLSSDKDFPSYKTSAPYVKNNFEEFEWIILAEFFCGVDAYAFEQQLIKSYWKNEKLLNGNYIDTILDRIYFSMEGRTHSQESRDKISEYNRNERVYTKGRKWTEEERVAHRTAIETREPFSPSEETRRKISESTKGRVPSEETKEKIRETKRSRRGTYSRPKLTQETKDKISNTTKGIPKPKIECPICGKIGGKPSMTQHIRKCK